MKGIELYKEKPVIYGCGDLLNDYEGIGGYKRYRGEIGIMYFVQIDKDSGRLESLLMKSTRLRNSRVNRAIASETIWLRDTLNREGKELGT